MAAPSTSPRPAPRPSNPPSKSPVPPARPNPTYSPGYIADRSTRPMKKGGAVSSEGTAKDMREDKAMAKKRGMSMKQWESSAADKKHDTGKMATGGRVCRGMGAAKKGGSFIKNG